VISLQCGGKILDIFTRLKGAIPAALKACSKLANFSLCCPFPLVRNAFVGMIELMDFPFLNDVNLTGCFIQAE